MSGADGVYNNMSLAGNSSGGGATYRPVADTNNSAALAYSVESLGPVIENGPMWVRGRLRGASTRRTRRRRGTLPPLSSPAQDHVLTESLPGLPGTARRFSTPSSSPNRSPSPILIRILPPLLPGPLAAAGAAPASDPTSVVGVAAYSPYATWTTWRQQPQPSRRVAAPPAATAPGGAPFSSITPHILMVGTGESVALGICVLSAFGSISSATLRQASRSLSDGTVTYEGRFQILSLTGSYRPLEHEGQRTRTGGLTVSISTLDGRVIGGSVAGHLRAAGPVQLVLGSFDVNHHNQTRVARPVSTGRFAGASSSSASRRNPSEDPDADRQGSSFVLAQLHE